MDIEPDHGQAVTRSRARVGLSEPLMVAALVCGGVPADLATPAGVRDTIETVVAVDGLAALDQVIARLADYPPAWVARCRQAVANLLAAERPVPRPTSAAASRGKAVADLTVCAGPRCDHDVYEKNTGLCACCATTIATSMAPHDPHNAARLGSLLADPYRSTGCEWPRISTTPERQNAMHLARIAADEGRGEVPQSPWATVRTVRIP
ncbi:hypothetical protein [Pseudofrankia sp. DC12]|uniref:hypothetical protein n=1 Tax=Pseudofrankia sp. DC12 TaxID=683315 RepID=UPI0005F8327D|nr:hypothetical protein [Pseudofrankia sp. DC12]